MKERLHNLCKKYHLGTLIEFPEMITGGLLHRMYRVTTTSGQYAIKALNPDIMKRPKALGNMIFSEIVAHKLMDEIPLVAAKEFEGKHVLEDSGYYYMIFDWLEGRSVFGQEITPAHCKQIGQILGRIHRADIRVDTMEQETEGREPIDWEGLLEYARSLVKKAQPQPEADSSEEKSSFYSSAAEAKECASILEKYLEALQKWDQAVLIGWQQVSGQQVTSHRDLDPKNVMWQGEGPDARAYIIDWEAAGYVKPYQELVEVLNYWIIDENGGYDREKFNTLMDAYTESMSLDGVDWDSIFSCSRDGMLGWLAYNVKRALGLEGSDTEDRQAGLQQMQGTIQELKQYDERIKQLKEWMEEYAGTNSL